MSETVIERLARRLSKCPFDQELFDSGKLALSLRLHLCEAHVAEICLPHRIARPPDSDLGERPRKLYCCPLCDFAVPNPGVENPLSAIINHIEVEHSRPDGGPVHIEFRIS